MKNQFLSPLRKLARLATTTTSPPFYVIISGIVERWGPYEYEMAPGPGQKPIEHKWVIGYVF